LLIRHKEYEMIGPATVSTKSRSWEITGPLVLLNTPRLTADGLFEMLTIRLEEARELVRKNGAVSAIGHRATAEILSALLATPCAARRSEHTQMPGETVLVFNLRRRLPEGAVLRTIEEIERVGYTFCLLHRIR
jgi:hypothetical protein